MGGKEDEGEDGGKGEDEREGEEEGEGKEERELAERMLSLDAMKNVEDSMRLYVTGEQGRRRDTSSRTSETSRKPLQISTDQN